jgi:hypothetical protein
MAQQWKASRGFREGSKKWKGKSQRRPHPLPHLPLLSPTISMACSLPTDFSDAPLSFSPN